VLTNEVKYFVSNRVPGRKRSSANLRAVSFVKP
jgi:hypothetical protein